MAGTAPDLPLQKNDVLYISSIKELEKKEFSSFMVTWQNRAIFPLRGI